MKVTIAGDYCPRERVAIAIERGDYSMIFGEVKEITCESDYSIVNLECPVVETPSQKINKCGPSLKCTGKGVSALKWAGFDCVTLANNHFLDYGETGVTQTLASCHSNGLDTVGGGINIEKASKTLFKTINWK